MSNNGTCTLCFYPSQVNHVSIDGNNNTNTNVNNKKFNMRLSSIDDLFRVNPFNDGEMRIETDSNKKLIKSEINNDKIFYIHFGNRINDHPAFYIKTPKMKWPEKYTILMWVKWDIFKKNQNITVFDSDRNAPIAVDMSSHLGCVSTYKWKFMSDCTIKFNEWQFILCLGGNRCSKYFVGDLSVNSDYIVPFAGEVDCDIGKRCTYRIGNRDQGPGKIACILVFDYQLSSHEIKKFYWETKNEICQQWNHQQIQSIGQILMKYISVKVIVDEIFLFTRLYTY